MTFADKLRELRDGRGMSEAKLAETAGIAFGTLHDYGVGRRVPSFPNVVKIAAALGEPVEAFAACSFPTEGPKLPTAPAKRRTGKMAHHPRKRLGQKGIGGK
jgi:transcriptional regulator with XRE-family HTH domain